MLSATYKKEIRATLQKELQEKNVFAVPTIEKVVVNAGIGKIGGDKQAVEEASRILALVTGQRPVVRRARMSIAGFSLREGSVVGLKTTLRGERAWSFVERLIGVALPRSRDFRGLPRSSVDSNGNLTIGIREHIIFPEVAEESTRRLYGFETTIVTTTNDRDRALAFFESIGVPIQKEDKE